MVRTAGGYRLLQRAMRIDWAARVSDCEDPQRALQRASLPALHRQNLERLAARSPRLKPSEMYNAVIIATYNESSDVLRPTVEAVMASDYDMKRVILLLAYEGRDGAQSEGRVWTLSKNTRPILNTCRPSNILRTMTKCGEGRQYYLCWPCAPTDCRPRGH